MIYTFRHKAKLLYINMTAAVLCGIIFFFASCVSVPAPREDTLPDTQTEASATPSADGVISPDDTVETKRASGKKTSRSSAKKLTVVYEQEEKEAVDFLGEYKMLTDSLKLSTDNRPEAVKNGNAFDSAFSVVVTDTEGLPAERAAITVKYPSNNLNGTVIFASEEIVTDEEGRAVFTSPIPEFSCFSEILFYITPEKTDAAVLQYAEEHALRMPYRVYTDKTHKVISVSILDYSPSGNPVRSNGFSSSAFLKVLYKRGFRRAGNADFIDEIHSGDARLLYKNASSLFSGAVDYLFFGTVKYASPVVQDADGLYTVTLQAEFSVMDMKSGTLLLNKKIDFTAKDKGEWALLDNMRNTMIAPALAEFVYYNF